MFKQRTTHRENIILYPYILNLNINATVFEACIILRRRSVASGQSPVFHRGILCRLILRHSVSHRVALPCGAKTSPMKFLAFRMRVAKAVLLKHLTIFLLVFREHHAIVLLAPAQAGVAQLGVPGQLSRHLWRGQYHSSPGQKSGPGTSS